MAAVEDHCSCTVPENSIHSAVFSCRNSNQAVVFKAKISIQNGVVTTEQMFKIISTWAKTSPSIIVLRSLLQVDPTCPTKLESFLANDCQQTLQHSTTHSIPEAEEHGDNAAEILTIVGSLVGVLVAATVIATIVIGIVVYHRAKRSKNHGSW